MTTKKEAKQWIDEHLTAWLKERLDANVDTHDAKGAWGLSCDFWGGQFPYDALGDDVRSMMLDDESLQEQLDRFAERFGVSIFNVPNPSL